MSSKNEPPRCVIDANVLFSGIGWRGVPHQIIKAALEEKITLILVQDVIDDTHYYLQRKAPQAVTTFEAFLSAGKFEIVASPKEADLTSHMHLVPRDPDDVVLVVVAIQHKAAYLISGDMDLLDPENKDIHEIVKVMSPRAFYDTVLSEL